MVTQLYWNYCLCLPYLNSVEEVSCYRFIIEPTMMQIGHSCVLEQGRVENPCKTAVLRPLGVYSLCTFVQRINAFDLNWLHVNLLVLVDSANWCCFRPNHRGWHRHQDALPVVHCGINARMWLSIESSMMVQVLWKVLQYDFLYMGTKLEVIASKSGGGGWEFRDTTWKHALRSTEPVPTSVHPVPLHYPTH